MVDRANRPSALSAPAAAAPEAQVDIVGTGPSSKVVATLPSGESRCETTTIAEDTNHSPHSKGVNMLKIRVAFIIGPSKKAFARRQ
jgi:hypothetical protein